jgi:hypothetical protein
MFGTYSQYTRLIMDNYGSKNQVENVLEKITNYNSQLESVWDGVQFFSLGKGPNSGL